MADSGINIALDRKTSHHLARLAEVTKEPIQKLAKRLIVEGIECEIEEIALADIVKECEAPGAETIKYEDFEQEWSIYKIELSKRYAKKDFPALSEETKSAIKKAIEEELKVKPTKVGKPLRGKLRGYRRLKFDKYRLIYHVNILERKVLLVTAGYRDNIYNQAGLLDLLPKL